MSGTNGRRRGRLKPIDKQTALEILESAIAYCQQAGFLVSAGNVAGKSAREPETLTIHIAGARLDKTGRTPRFIASNSAGSMPEPESQEVASNDLSASG